MSLVLSDAMVADAAYFGTVFARAHKLARWADECGVAALEGMWRATIDYVPEKGESFHHYARIRMRGAILDWCRKEQEYSNRNRASYKRNVVRLGLEQIALKCPLQRVPMIPSLCDRLVAKSQEIVVEPCPRTKRILNLLPPKGRQVVCLVVMEGRTLRVAGMMLGITESGACQMLHRSLRLLQEHEIIPPEVAHA